MSQLITEEEYNKRIRTWSIKLRNIASSAVRSGAKKGHGDLANSIKYKIKREYGLTTRITYQFNRYGVFRAYGVGRGYIREGGKVIRARRPSKEEGLFAKNQNRELTHIPLSGILKRKPLDWFDKNVNAHFDELAQIVHEFYGDKVLVESAQMKINKNEQSSQTWH